MTKKTKTVSLIFLSLIFLSGCVKEPQIYDYSSFLQSKPRSILVLMPTNESLDEKASAAVLANALFPLSEAGYYIFPVALVNDTFKHNGITEPSEIAQIPLHKLKQIFAADAALYINVINYGTTYMVLDSVTQVTVEAKLVDINTGNVLWQKSATAANQSGGGGDLLGSMISALIKQVIDSSTDASFNLSAHANRILFATDCRDCILYGPYSSKYGRDDQLTKNVK